MPWPLQRQVPAVPLAIAASSAGGPMSCPPPALASPALASPALASPALGASVLGCATARPVIPTIAIATREKVFICHAPGEKARTVRTRDRDHGARWVPLPRRQCRGSRRGTVALKPHGALWVLW